MFARTFHPVICTLCALLCKLTAAGSGVNFCYVIQMLEKYLCINDINKITKTDSMDDNIAKTHQAFT